MSYLLGHDYKKPDKCNINIHIRINYFKINKIHTRIWKKKKQFAYYHINNVFITIEIGTYTVKYIDTNIYIN